MTVSTAPELRPEGTSASLIRCALGATTDRIVGEVEVVADLERVLEISTVGQGERAATMQLTGEVDVVTVPLLAQVLAAQLGRGRRLLRLDLSRLEFCDCAGLAVLLDSHHQLLRQRGTLVLFGCTARMLRLLRLTGLDTVLLIAEGIGEPHHVRRRRPDRVGTPPAASCRR